METMYLIDSIVGFLFFSSALLLILGLLSTLVLRILKIEGQPKLWICTLLVIMPLAYPLQSFFPDPIQVSIPPNAYESFDFQKDKATTGQDSAFTRASFASAHKASPDLTAAGMETALTQSEISSADPEPRPIETVSSFPVNWKLIATLAWVLISLFLLARLITMVYHTSRFLKFADPVTDPHILRLLEKCAAETGLRRTPRLLTVDRIPAPMVMGFFKPGILLPKHLLNPEYREGLRFTLLHELKHVQRHHTWWLLIESLIGTAYFFHPVIHWAKKRIREELEHICDNHVIQITNKSVSYADFLLHEIWQRNRESNPALALPFISGEAKTTERVRSILKNTRPSLFAQIRGRVAVSLMLLSFALLFLTSVTPSAKEPEQVLHKIYPATMGSQGKEIIQAGPVDTPTALEQKEVLPEGASSAGLSEKQPSADNTADLFQTVSSVDLHDAYEEDAGSATPEDPEIESEPPSFVVADARIEVGSIPDMKPATNEVGSVGAPAVYTDAEDSLVLAQNESSANVESGSTPMPEETKAIKYLGPPKDSLMLHRVNETRILDDQTILFIMYGGDLYLNRLPVRVPGLYIADGFSFKAFSSDKITKFDRIQALSPGRFSGSTGFLGEFFPFRYEGKRTDAIKLLKKGLLKELVEEGAFPEAFPGKG